MTKTITPFTSQSAGNFGFQASFDGATYTITTKWSLFGQRFYVQVVDSGQNIIYTMPLVESSDSADINLNAGYFKTPMVFRGSSQSFEVTN